MFSFKGDKIWPWLIGESEISAFLLPPPFLLLSVFSVLDLRMSLEEEEEEEEEGRGFGARSRMFVCNGGKSLLLLGGSSFAPPPPPRLTE